MMYLPGNLHTRNQPLYRLIHTHPTISRELINKDTSRINVGVVELVVNELRLAPSF